MPTGPRATLTVRDRSAEVRLNLTRLAGDRVLVGIPAAEATRKGAQPVNNAQLLYIFTNGSTMRKQPARPVIEAALAQPATRNRILRQLRQAVELEMDGEHAEAMLALGRAGQLGANACKRWFTDPQNGWAPNAPSTLRRKAAKAQKGQERDAFLAAIKAGTDTAQWNTVGVDLDEMRRAITFVVRG